MPGRSTEGSNGATARRGSPVPGLVGMATITVIAPMLGMFGVDEVAKALATFLAGVVAAIIGVRACQRPVGIFGMIVLMLPPLVTMILIELPPLGGIAHQPVAQAPDAWWAAGFRFTDATLRIDMKTAEVVMVSTGRGSPRRPTTYAVAPVVSPGWTPAEPVRVWAVDEANHVSVADWRQPLAAGVRLLQNRYHDEAVEAAAKRLGVVSAGNRVLVRWVADPVVGLLAGWIQLLSIIGVGGVCWILLVWAFGRFSSRGRRR